MTDPFLVYMTCSETFFQSVKLLASNTNLKPRETLGLRCAHIAQLMTHTAIFTHGCLACNYVTNNLEAQGS